MYKISVISLPDYIILVDNNTNIRQTRQFNDNDRLKYKCTVTPRIDAFLNSYFVRTTKSWNALPFEIRSINSVSLFKIRLKQLLWLIAEQDLGLTWRIAVCFSLGSLINYLDGYTLWSFVWVHSVFLHTIQSQPFFNRSEFIIMGILLLFFSGSGWDFEPMQPFWVLRAWTGVFLDYAIRYVEVYCWVGEYKFILLSVSYFNKWFIYFIYCEFYDILLV